MKRLIYILIFATVPFQGCETFLDEKPKDLIDPDGFYVTEADGLAAITGIYFHLMHNHAFNGDYIDDYFGLSDDLTTPSRALGGRIFFAYRWDENTSHVRDIWRRLYMAINDANVMISKLMESNLEQGVKQDLIAEAIFLRAFTYHYLVNLMKRSYSSLILYSMRFPRLGIPDSNPGHRMKIRPEGLCHPILTASITVLFIGVLQKLMPPMI